MEQAGQGRAAAALPREMENEGLPLLTLSQAKNGRFKPERESTFVFLEGEGPHDAAQPLPAPQQDILVF